MKLHKILGFNVGKGKHEDYKHALSEFNKSLSLIMDYGQLRANIVSKIQDVTNVEKVFLFLYNEDYHRYTLTNTIGVNKSPYSKYYFTQKDKLIYWLSVNEKYVALDRHAGVYSFFSPHEQNMLKDMEVNYIHSLKVTNRLTGFVFLGKRMNGKDYGKDEIELLTILLDQAALAFENANLFQSQKDRMKKMYRADRLAILGQLAAGAAHEIRNPLTSIRGTIQYVQKDIKDPVKVKMTSQLLNEVDRINGIVQGLLSFSSPDELNAEMIDLEQLINQTVLLTLNAAREKNCEIYVEYNTEKKDLMADPSQLKQVFLNIIMNAIYSIQDTGKVNIIVDWNDSSVSNLYRQRQEYIITFIDNGTGISPENMEKIFDPFFTTKEDGTGLGLSISYGIIVQHGGDIKVESEPGKGTKVMVKLPVDSFNT
jgi:signal transduction histidine kinase